MEQQNAVLLLDRDPRPEARAWQQQGKAGRGAVVGVGGGGDIGTDISGK
jgi:hypothetical protein